MAIDPLYDTQFGPYNWFDFGSTLKSIKINVGGVLQTVKSIYINVGDVLKKVKRVLDAKADNNLYCSFDDKNQLTFDIKDSVAYTITKPSGTAAPCLYEIKYLNYFTCGGNRVYLPIGWAGKISFWQASTIYGPPTNTATTRSWFENNTINAGFTGAFYKNSTATITSTTQTVLPKVAGAYRAIPANGVIADWASTSAAPSSIVNAAHETNFSNADGTFFSFNKYHQFTALTDNIYGIVLMWYGGSCSAHTYYENTFSKLRMCVTTTSTIQPIFGTNGITPANSGLI